MSLRSPTTLLATIVLALLLAGCGARFDASSGSPDTTPTTTDPGANNGNSGNNSGSTAPDDPDLAALLVTADDLPLGWTLDTSPSDTSGDTNPDCIDAVNELVADAPTADASFSSEDTGEYFTESITRVDRTPRRTFNEIADTLDACSEVSFRNNGELIPGIIEPWSFYDHGDDSAAWRLTFTTGRALIEYDLVVVRYGDLVVSYTFAGLHPIDEDAFDDLILTAEDVLAADPNSDPGSGPSDPGPRSNSDPSGELQTA
ncbi:MAG: hypothetical protein KGR18_11175 [Acidobacteria bacterium]|nr:hypothetical protein [Acidobacteriota bacterium]